MNNPLTLLWVGAAGAALSVLYHAGLWWTVRRGITATRPAVWFSVSLIVRFSLVAAGFYLLAAGQWQRVLACLIGFLVARILAIRAAARWEVRHAP